MGGSPPKTTTWCGPWRGGFPGVENASADCRLFLLRKSKSKSKSIQLHSMMCMIVPYKTFFKGNFLLFGKQLLPNTPQPSEILNENKHFSRKKKKKKKKKNFPPKKKKKKKKKK